MYFLSKYPAGLLFFYLSWLEIVFTAIDRPTNLEGQVGGDVVFKWNTTNGTEILSAIWGIRRGDTLDPQFINVNKIKGRPTISDLPKQYAGRVQFVGNLTQGHAWFVIRNLTMNDTNYYIARISEDDVSKLSSYSVHLKVNDRLDYLPTSSTFPFAPTSNASTTKAPSSKTLPPTSTQATSKTPHASCSFSIFLFSSGLTIAFVAVA